jgi:hypothetical protein
MILKMNFNFNFKDIPGAPNTSIRHLTTARDGDRAAFFRPRNASRCREGTLP